MSISVLISAFLKQQQQVQQESYFAFILSSYLFCIKLPFTDCWIRLAKGPNSGINFFGIHESVIPARFI